MTTHSSFISADSNELEVVLADSEVHVDEHPPGEESPEHTHEEDYIMFMRSGRMRWEVDGEVRETGPGETILTEAGRPASIRNAWRRVSLRTVSSRTTSWSQRRWHVSLFLWRCDRAMSTTFDFGDHVVLVTGASGSLGTTTVNAFHEGGATVCLTARHRPEKDDIALDSDRLSFYKGDLTDEASAAQVVDNVVTDHGQLDVLVNLIGTWRGSTKIDETDVESFEFLFDINLKTCSSRRNTQSLISATRVGVSSVRVPGRPFRVVRVMAPTEPRKPASAC